MSTGRSPAVSPLPLASYRCGSHFCAWLPSLATRQLTLDARDDKPLAIEAVADHARACYGQPVLYPAALALSSRARPPDAETRVVPESEFDGDLGAGSRVVLAREVRICGRCGVDEAVRDAELAAIVRALRHGPRFSRRNRTRGRASFGDTSTSGTFPPGWDPVIR
ncbi:hypothetical protein GCM10010094_93880 [Streptomyces flaveus]|uniref:Uncharacterized protein n=1 Tax=Streptomyces flaveus TaxID=66370 RepID=A0A917RQP6_9ACTN|nr:hypothetical protein GCM10010094_93880 [Streptomyces flaveus]